VHTCRKRRGNGNRNCRESGDAEDEKLSHHESSFREGFDIEGERQVF